MNDTGDGPPAVAVPVLVETERHWKRIWLGRGLDQTQHEFRRELLRVRVHTLAWVLALAMLAWIPLDALGMQRAVWIDVALLRLALAGAFFAAAWWLRARHHARHALALLALLVVTQCVAFCGMHSWLPPSSSELLRLGYTLYPFVVMAQLALFPLSVAQGVLLSLPILLLRGAALAMNEQSGALNPLADLWLMLLLMLVAVWAAAAQLSLLLSLVRARRDASHDALTGLANRRAALDRLNAELARAQRTRQPLSLLMLDLDHFKRVNDRWGHAIGDRVLVETAHVLRGELRGADLGVRFGGEEFLAILPGTDLQAAGHVAGRIRQRMAETTVDSGKGEAIRCTISIGAAALREGESADELLARADAALYRAKDSGRDRVDIDLD